MREHVDRDLLDVVRNDVVAAADERERTRRARKRQGRAGTCPDKQFGRSARRVDDVEQIIGDRGIELDLFDRFAYLFDLFQRENRLERRERVALPADVENSEFRFPVGISDRKTHHEAVELAFRKRIDALKFDRILRRDDEERIRKRVRLAVGYGNGNSFYYGDVCQLTATPYTRSYVFSNWSENGTILSTDNPYRFEVFENRTITANFIQDSNTYTITISTQYDPDNGTVQFDTPDTYTITISEEGNGTVQFDTTTNTITISDDGNGTVNFNN